MRNNSIQSSKMWRAALTHDLVDLTVVEEGKGCTVACSPTPMIPGEVYGNSQSKISYSTSTRTLLAFGKKRNSNDWLTALWIANAFILALSNPFSANLISAARQIFFNARPDVCSIF